MIPKVWGGRQKTAAANFRLQVLESGCSWPSSLKMRTIKIARRGGALLGRGTVSTRSRRIASARS